MNEENITHEINLIGGYVDGSKIPHRRVVFGKRITCADLIRLDSDPQAQEPTQYQDAIVCLAITEWEPLRMPVALSIVLDLDSIDRDDLAAGYEDFQKNGVGDREAEVSEKGAKLLFGFHIGDLDYTVVEFGRRLTGRDEVDADKRGLKPGVARMCFLVGRQISKISISDGSASVDGPIELEIFESLDGADVQLLRGAAELWRQSFRLSGGGLPGKSQGSSDSES